VNGEQLKQKVNSGGIVYGTMISLGRNPRWSSAFSNFGLDYAILDTDMLPEVDRKSLITWQHLDTQVLFQ